MLPAAGRPLSSSDLTYRVGQSGLWFLRQSSPEESGLFLPGRHSGPRTNRSLNGCRSANSTSALPGRCRCARAQTEARRVVIARRGRTSERRRAGQRPPARLVLPRPDRSGESARHPGAGVHSGPAEWPRKEAAARVQAVYSASRMRRMTSASEDGGWPLTSASEDGGWPINSINESRFSITELRSRGVAPRLIESI